MVYNVNDVVGIEAHSTAVLLETISGRIFGSRRVDRLRTVLERGCSFTGCFNVDGIVQLMRYRLSGNQSHARVSLPSDYRFEK